MPSKKIRSLRFCRYPLICGIVLSGLLILRVPVGECFTPKVVGGQTSPEKNINDSAVAVNAAAADSVDHPLPDEEVSTGSPTEVAAGPSLNPALDATTAEPDLASFDEVENSLRGHTELARGILQSVPKLLDGVAKVTQATGSLVEAEHATPAPAAADVVGPQVETFAEAIEPQLPPAIVIRNSKQSGGVIHFLVGDDVRSLKPGEELRLPVQEKLHLQFHRGGTFGNTERWLSDAGIYEFTVSKAGWALAPLIGTSR